MVGRFSFRRSELHFRSSRFLELFEKAVPSARIDGYGGSPESHFELFTSRTIPHFSCSPAPNSFSSFEFSVSDVDELRMQTSWGLREVR